MKMETKIHEKEQKEGADPLYEAELEAARLELELNALKEGIMELQKLAIDRQIHERAVHIVDVLTNDYTYEDAEIYINHNTSDPSFSIIEIRYKPQNQVVFKSLKKRNQHGISIQNGISINTYKPGKWETILEELKQKCPLAQQQRENEQLREEITRLKKEWSLT